MWYRTYFLNGLLFLLLAFGTFAQAEETVPDNFQLRLGAYLLADQNTDAKVSRNGAGATINLQDLFKMDEQSQVFRLDGYYRFAPSHSVEFAWYSINNKSHTNEPFQWADQNITGNGDLKTHFNTDIYKINYVYSFYHNEKVELGLDAGLHITKLDIGFSGSYNIDGNLSDTSREEVKVTAPLPVVGFRLQYHIMPTVSVKYAVDYFVISYEDTRGGLVDTILTVDWKMTRHFGAGVGFNSTRMRLRSKLDNGGELLVNHDVSGALIYGMFTF